MNYVNNVQFIFHQTTFLKEEEKLPPHSGGAVIGVSILPGGFRVVVFLGDIKAPSETLTHSHDLGWH